MDFTKPTNIMIIDDDEINNFIVEKTIKKVCKSTKIAVWLNTWDAIASLSAIFQEGGDLPEFIFLDLFAPSMNGWNFLDEYNLLAFSKAGQSRIVVLTASIFHRDIDLALSHVSVDNYISKPITDKNLKSLFSKSDSAQL